MSKEKQTCNNCRYSYHEKDLSKHPTIGLLRQHCRSKDYNSPEYTDEMALADRGNDRCRFWKPQKRKEKKENEE